MSEGTKKQFQGFWAPDTHKEPLKLYRKFFLERRLGNWMIGGALFAFCGGIYYYTITAVTQEDFTTGIDDRGFEKPKE